jgi:hemerythrin-like domain-containing protein
VTFSQAGQRLVDDHEDLHRLLEQLKNALRELDSESVRSRLDLFWARLAVHIRAEHLRLFPAVISAAPSLVAQLREDHDFFMHELAAAIATLPDLNQVATMVNAVEQRLTTHNELEESQIYGLIGSILSQEEQAKLASQIDAELMKHPPRFSERTWVG